jgi:hypothetical protein
MGVSQWRKNKPTRSWPGGFRETCYATHTPASTYNNRWRSGGDSCACKQDTRGRECRQRPGQGTRPGQGIQGMGQVGGNIVRARGLDCAVTFSGWQQLGEAWLSFCSRFVLLPVCPRIDHSGGCRLRAPINGIPQNIVGSVAEAGKALDSMYSPSVARNHSRKAGAAL